MFSVTCLTWTSLPQDCMWNGIVQYHLLCKWELDVRICSCCSENLSLSVSLTTSQPSHWISSFCTSCGKAMYLFFTPCHICSYIFMTPVFPVHYYSSFILSCVFKQAKLSFTYTGDLPSDNLWVAFSSPSFSWAEQHLQWLQPVLLWQPSPESSCRQGSRLLHSSN